VTEKSARQTKQNQIGLVSNSIMRKIIVAEFVSLDGVMKAPGPEEDTGGGPPEWIASHRDPVSSAAAQKRLNMPFDLLLGRITLNFGQDSGRNIMTFGQPSTQRPSTSPRIP